MEGFSMPETLAYCGLVCQTCPIYLAAREMDAEMQRKKRAKIARFAKTLYGLDLKAEEITDCDGCTSEDGRMFATCKNCPIRTCAREKGLENCAYCPEYACDALSQFFKTEPACQERLEGIRNHLHA
jgi:hypothetical protein